MNNYIVKSLFTFHTFLTKKKKNTLYFFLELNVEYILEFFMKNNGLGNRVRNKSDESRMYQMIASLPCNLTSKSEIFQGRSRACAACAAAQGPNVRGPNF